MKRHLGHNSGSDESMNLFDITSYKINTLENVIYDKNHSFNNWGGIIKSDDVKDLNVKFQKQLDSCKIDITSSTNHPGENLFNCLLSVSSCVHSEN